MNPYDRIPYDNFPCPTSHPDSLGAIARLYGLRPAAVTECQVLELGCGTGGNLLPMASAYPRSRFTGVDSSSGQIETARQAAKPLELANLTLEVGDLASLDGSRLGRFDFIIAHGVFSWVPAAVQQGLLKVIRECLSEQGVAYVSYSVAPGASARQALREMLAWGARGETEPAPRVAAARKLAEQLSEHLPTRAPQAAAIRRLIGELGGMSDAYVLHDYLSETHEAVTVSQFMQRARGHQLQYLADAQLHTAFGPEITVKPPSSPSDPTGERLAQEQLQDFFSGRSFRTTLLCRAEATVDPKLTWERLTDLHLTTRAQPRGEEDGHWMFRAPGGDLFGTTSELVGSALSQLCESHPRPVAFGALCDLARGSVDGQPATPADRELLGINLLAAAQADQVTLGTGDRGIRANADEPLLAFRSARAQAALAQHEGITNLWHQPVTLGPELRKVLTLLDGTRNRAALLTSLAADQPGADDAWLEEQLSTLAENALLIG